MKTCSTCNADKPLSEFGKKGNRLQPSCNPCRAASAAEYRAANRDQVGISQAAYRAANREKLRDRGASYRTKNRKLLNAKGKNRTSSMPDAYIAHLLAMGRGALTRDHIPQVLIDAKREHLKLLRLIKDMTA